MSDARIRELERLAGLGDAEAAERLVVEKIRLGEIPEGAIVTLDHERGATGDWPLAWGKRGDAPKKFSGRWLVEESWRGDGYRRLTRVGRSGRPLKRTTNNDEHLSLERILLLAVSAEPHRARDVPEKKHEAAPDGAPTVRRFSIIGPCLTQGQLVRETKKFYVVESRNGPERSNRKIRKSAVHVEPCVSCMDHPNTQYPYGYMD